MNFLKKYQNVALSNHNILSLLNNKANIVLYPELYKYNSIDELLNPFGCCILLFEAQPNYGHWVVLTRTNNKTIEFFNSYGGLPDGSLDKIDIRFRKDSNQDYPYLSELLYKSPYHLTYNEFKFQKHDRKIKTCGRHCVVRALLKSLDIYQYKQFLDELCDLFNIGRNYDYLVTLLTTK